MSLEGFLYLHRKLAEWEWYDDANTMRLFIHCLIFANFKEKQWRGVTIKRGQFITSQPKLAQELKLSIQSIRTALNKLKSTGELTVYTTADYSIITVKNYDLYQQNNRQENRLLTDNQQATNRLLTTTNNDNNDNNEKKYRERDRKILENYLLNKKRAKPIDNIDAYIDNIQPDSLERLIKKAQKWQENQEKKKERSIQNEVAEQEITPEEQEKIREIQQRIRKGMKK